MQNNYSEISVGMVHKKNQIVSALSFIFLKCVCVIIMLWIIISSVHAHSAHPIWCNSELLMFKHEVDSGLKKTDPNLIYTTREYFFNLQPIDLGNMYVKDFNMMLIFDIGVTMKDEVKQIGFKEATMDFNAKQGGGAFSALKFSKYITDFNTATRKIILTFYPDKPKSTQTKQPVTKCIFNGIVKKAGVTGLFTFYFPNGETQDVEFNPGL